MEEVRYFLLISFAPLNVGSFYFKEIIMKTKVIKRMCFDAIFAAISIVLYVFGPKFPLPFIFPGFLDIQFSMLPILIITFMLGPVDGLIVILVRFFVKVFAFSSFTTPYGELSDLIYSIVVILAISLVYSKLKKQENVSNKRRFVTLFITIVCSTPSLDTFKVILGVVVLTFKSKSLNS